MEKKFKIKISEREHLHLLNVMGNRSVTTDFGPRGAFVTGKSEAWAVKEIAKLRGVLPPN
jgi:hypothetical protein